MTTGTQPSPSEQSQASAEPQPAAQPAAQAEKILCPHCKRTASNGIKCLGICVADSDY